MISAFLPLAGSPATRARRKTRGELRLAACVFVTVLLLEAALFFLRDGLVLHPLQSSTLFKQVSGYGMAGLLLFAMVFGWLRRRPALAPRLRTLNELHQFAGLLLLLLLGLHAARAPQGFLLLVFHAMAVACAAGALRALVGARIGRLASTTLLVVHIGLACIVSAAAAVHLYLVYAYTA